MRDGTAAPPPPIAWPPILALAGVSLAVHLLTAGHFGIFRDELYYLACADRLAWGYVDHPPLSIGVLALARGALGDGLWALRLPAALASGAVVVVGALLARELGGRRPAQALAALVLLIAPIVLVMGTFWSMNVLEQLFWLLGAWLLTRALRTGSDRWWPLLGLVIGLGVLNKLSLGVFALAMTGGLLLTGHRRRLLRPAFWLAPAVAALVFLPHVLWQAAGGWPVREFAANAQANKIAITGVGGYLAENALEAHPFSLLIWLPGLLWLLLGGGRRFRPLGWLYLLALAIMLLQRTKPYYLAPAYLILLAAGSVAVTGWLSTRRPRWPLPALATLLVLGGLFTLPLSVPLLSPGATMRYLTATGLQPNTGETSHRGAPLPQYFADRFAWREQVDAVAAAYAALPAADRARCAILCANYGQAGAVEHFGRRHGLPVPCCGHNSYYGWWPDDVDGGVAIAVGIPAEALADLYGRIETVAVLDVPYAMPWEGRATVLLCRDPRLPLREARNHFRYFG